MSVVSFTEKLLNGASADWKPMGDFGVFIRGRGMHKKDLTESGFPAVHYGQIHTKYGLAADRTLSFVSEKLAEEMKKGRKNDLLLATTSETDEDVAKPLAWLGGEVAVSGDMVIFRHEQSAEYLAYFIQTEAFQKQKRKYITGTKVRRISVNSLAKILIPVPPLRVQKEIVSILNKFDIITKSINEGLPYETELRKKQYEYYRNALFDF